MNDMEATLVAALRSGKYKQGRNVLKYYPTATSPPEYCCLGVACDISRFADWDESRYPASLYMHNEYHLPGEVRDALGWSGAQGPLDFTNREGHQMNLIILNDDGFTFDQIADIIEAGLVCKF